MKSKEEMKKLTQSMLKLISTLVTLCLSLNVYPQESLGRQVITDSVKNELVVRKFSKMPMKFKSPLNKSDTLYIGVMADSVSPNQMILRIYGYFPQNIQLKDMSIILEYVDGSEDAFELLDSDENNYATFGIINDLNFIYRKDLVLIKFRNFAVYKVEHKNKNFFVNFFKEYR